MTTSSAVIANFDRDQRNAIQLLNRCLPMIQNGMSETDVIELFEQQV